MILQEEIDDSAVMYVKAVQNLGGVLNYGYKNHEELINTEQTKIKDYWHNKPSKWYKGKRKAWELGLMESVKVGDGCFIRVRISNKGKMVLEQLV